MRSTNSRTPSLRSWDFPLQGYKEPSLRMEGSLQCNQLLTIWYTPGFVGKLIKLWWPYALSSLAFERAVAGCWAYATAAGCRQPAAAAALCISAEADLCDSRSEFFALHFCRGKKPLRESQRSASLCDSRSEFFALHFCRGKNSLRESQRSASSKKMQSESERTLNISTTLKHYIVTNSLRYLRCRCQQLAAAVAAEHLSSNRGCIEIFCHETRDEESISHLHSSYTFAAELLSAAAL